MGATAFVSVTWQTGSAGPIAQPIGSVAAVFGSGRVASSTLSSLSVSKQSTALTSSSHSTSSSGTSGSQEPGNFSIFWITDTQFLSESNPSLFKNTTEWIAANWASYDGRMVVHTGDIVEDGINKTQWRNANAAMSVFLDRGIPYTWDAGNHDDLILNNQDSGWNGNVWAPAFNASVAKADANAQLGTFWAGDYHNGMDTAVGFTANGLDFLIVNIEWNGDPGTVLNWVAGILDNPLYADYNIIIATHAYIDMNGSLNDPRWGTYLADFIRNLTSLMDKHSAQVFLTLNGHFYTETGYHTPYPTNNRNELMFNRQDCLDNPGCPPADVATSDKLKVGAATVTILTFDTSRNKISVRTYDVYKGQFMRDPQDEYSINMFSNRLNYSTTTSVSCQSPAAVETASTCTSTISGAYGSAEGETVSFTASGSGRFDHNSCTVGGGNCSVNYTPTVLSGSPQTITATYPGDAFNAASSGTALIIVDKAAPRVTTILSAFRISVGQSVNDSAKLPGATSDAGGTVQYEYFDSGRCTGSPTDVGGPVAVTNGTVPNSQAQAFVAAGWYGWKAVYSGDPNNDGATSGCEPLLVGRGWLAPAISVSQTTVETLGGGQTQSGIWSKGVILRLADSAHPGRIALLSG